jgi:hypothetical protein
MFTLFGIDDLFGFSLIFLTMLDYFLHVGILFSFFYGIFTWIRGFYDGVKPPKGQDCGRSFFSSFHDRDRGDME